MPKTIDLTLSPKQAADEETFLSIAARMLRIDRRQIAFARTVKRSVDARNRVPRVTLTLDIYIDDERQPEPLHFDYPDVSGGRQVVIVGGGPAGLFAALRLIEAGRQPVILERGKQVSERKRDVAAMSRNERFNPDSNYAFGEGGAGTFSDGKLFTRSKKRGNYRRVLEGLVFHGASPEILFEAHPHIGTDRLPAIIENIRKTILSHGGRIMFDTKVTDLVIRDGRVAGVKAGDDTIEADTVILATGHSAHDIYHMLHRRGIRLEAKAFAMGVRAEHPQELIDSIQYHSLEYRRWLPAAAYNLVAQIGGRGVYSFCMCPGGIVVPAMTSTEGCVVNGMSSSVRGSQWANSGVVTEIRESDFAHLRDEWGELAGLRYQEILEQAARDNGGKGQQAPAQRLDDFVFGRTSQSLPRSSYAPGTVNSRMDLWLPPVIADSLRGGFKAFNGKMHGYLTGEAQILGVESRTSSPVRIPRDRTTLQHPQIAGLYPAGEGAGYAGGIVSAAVDGERIAEVITGIGGE